MDSWSRTQDGQQGVGGMITYDPRRDVMTFVLPLHRQQQEVLLRVYPNNKVTCLLIRGGGHEGAVESNEPSSASTDDA